jgi:hypothetical protein
MTGMILTMTKHINSIFIVLAVLSFSAVYAAEEESEADIESESSAEEVVLSQADDTDSETAESPQGDDDFVPSAQISEDLSVSFPVDI